MTLVETLCQEFKLAPWQVEAVISLLRETFRFIAGFEGEIPGAAEAECGNFRDHDLAGAKAVAADYAAVLEDWTPGKMAYRT